MRPDLGTTFACADDSSVRRRPLFDIDPGWLFVVAGLALCVAGVLIPAHRDLHELRGKLESLRESEQMSNERLRLHARFLADLEQPDEALIRRLAAVQLNLVPAGDVPVVLASSHDAGLTDWIESRAARMAPQIHSSHTPWPTSMLSRLASGPQRLWLLGGGVLAVFAGLMLGPSRHTSRQSSNAQTTTATAAPSPDHPTLLCLDERHGIEEAEDDEHREHLEARNEKKEDEEVDEEDLVCEIVAATAFAKSADEDLAATGRERIKSGPAL